MSRIIICMRNAGLPAARTPLKKASVRLLVHDSEELGSPP